MSEVHGSQGLGCAWMLVATGQRLSCSKTRKARPSQHGRIRLFRNQGTHKYRLEAGEPEHKKPKQGRLLPGCDMALCRALRPRRQLWL